MKRQQTTSAGTNIFQNPFPTTHESFYSSPKTLGSLQVSPGACTLHLVFQFTQVLLNRIQLCHVPDKVMFQPLCDESGETCSPLHLTNRHVAESVKARDGPVMLYIPEWNLVFTICEPPGSRFRILKLNVSVCQLSEAIPVVTKHTPDVFIKIDIGRIPFVKFKSGQAIGVDFFIHISKRPGFPRFRNNSEGFSFKLEIGVKVEQTISGNGVGKIDGPQPHIIL